MSDLAFIQLSEVSVNFSTGFSPIQSLSFSVEPHEFVSILGPSGCGKSTLLRIIAGLLDPSSGQVSFRDPGVRKSFVFQDAHLLPWRTVLSNVCLPRELREGPQPVIQEKARHLLQKVGLHGVEHFFPHQLSGGMKMRASLARALMNDPHLLLLDEPFAALDEISRQKLDEDLRSLWRENQMTVLFVTHNVSEAAFLSTRAIVLGQRPAGILLDERVDLPEVRTRNLKFEEPFTKVIARLARSLEEGVQ